MIMGSGYGMNISSYLWRFILIILLPVQALSSWPTEKNCMCCIKHDRGWVSRKWHSLNKYNASLSTETSTYLIDNIQIIKYTVTSWTKMKATLYLYSGLVLSLGWYGYEGAASSATTVCRVYVTGPSFFLQINEGFESPQPSASLSAHYCLHNEENLLKGPSHQIAPKSVIGLE
jgi:hypothetical protein